MARRNAVIRQVRGITLAAKADSSHWVFMDGAEAHGGNNGGSTPKELVLMALGGCTAMDVIPIMKKKRVPFTDIEIHVSGETRDEHPQIFTSIHIEYVVTGDGIAAADVERAIELSSTRYCAVSAMLSGTVSITHSYRIVTPS